ncbi:MAG: 5-formyltetrahydrofolate cyclo-ligase [Nitrospiria bacterium]
MFLNVDTLPLLKGLILDIAASKKALRQELHLVRKEISLSARQEKSKEISKRLITSDSFQAARSIQFYLANAVEVETVSMIQEALRLKKRVAVPVLTSKMEEIYFSELTEFNPDHLETGPYGIPQPRPAFQKHLALEAIDLWVVPGLGFDMQGNRLGYGSGYYDRALHRSQNKAVGLAFDRQIVKHLPVEATDRPVDLVITETRTIICMESKNGGA